jgi:hypothetical protein
MISVIATAVDDINRYRKTNAFPFLGHEVPRARVAREKDKEWKLTVTQSVIELRVATAGGMITINWARLGAAV